MEYYLECTECGTDLNFIHYPLISYIAPESFHAVRIYC